MADQTDHSSENEIGFISAEAETGNPADENEELRLLSFTPGIIRLLEQGRIHGRRIIPSGDLGEINPHIRELVRDGMFDPNFALDVLDSVSGNVRLLTEEQKAGFWEKTKLMRNVMVAIIGSLAMDYMEYVLEHNGEPPKSLSIFGTELPIKIVRAEDIEAEELYKGFGYSDIVRYSDIDSGSDNYTLVDIQHIEDGFAQMFSQYYEALRTVFYSMAFGLSHDNPLWILGNNFSRLIHIGNVSGMTAHISALPSMTSSQFILRGFGTFVQLLKNILEVAYYDNPSRDSVKSVFSKSWGACLILAKGDLHVRPYSMSTLLNELPSDNFGTPTSPTQKLLKVDGGKVVVNTKGLEVADVQARKEAHKLEKADVLAKRGTPRVVTYCPGLTNVNGKGSMIKRAYRIANTILERSS